MKERLARLGERWPWLGVVLGIQERFGTINGGMVAAAITLTAFLSLFPLVLVGIAAFGFVSSGRPDLGGDVIDALGLTGDAADTMLATIETAEESRRAASTVGLAGLAWSALGLVGALQYGFNCAWQVTGRGLRDRLMGVAWLAGAALLFGASFALAALLNYVPVVLAPVSVVLGLALNVALWLWTSHTLSNRDVGWRALLPGAVLGGVGFEVLKVLGAIYVPHTVASSSALYGSLGVVFAILAWLFFFGRLIVYSAVLNVVLWERSHGTVSVQMEAPHIPGEVPLAADRAGQVTERTRPPDGRTGAR